MSPHAKDMTDRQRRWWFAHLDEEKTSQGPGTELPRRSRYLTEAQRRRIEERKETAFGRMHGWAYVSGKTVQYQPRDTLEHHYEQGFKEGVTDAKEWVTGMWGLAEKLGDMAEKAWDAISNAPPFRDFLNPPDLPVSPGGVRQTRPSAKGDLKFHSPEELARRLEVTTEEFHSQVKKLMKDQFWYELKQIGNPSSPDILLDKRGHIWLRNRKTGSAVYTGQPLSNFKK